MHPTQHTTIHRRRPPILRRHELITQGVSRQTADTFVVQAVSGLLSLSNAPAKKLHIAPAPAQMPGRAGLTKLLSDAAAKAQTFSIQRAPMPGSEEAA